MRDYSSIESVPSNNLEGNDLLQYSSMSDLIVRKPKPAASPPSAVGFLKMASLMVLSAILAVLCVIFLISNTGWGVSNGTADIGDGIDDYLPRGIVIASKTKFTLVRDGYKTMPYFTSDLSTSSIVKYTILSGFDAVIEPHANMQFRYLSGASETASVVKYSVCADDDVDECYTGQYSADDDSESEMVAVACSPFSKYTIQAEEFDKSGTSIQSFSGTGLCMYVRREIRDLSSDDLSAAMDAMYTLWATDESSGQDLYGEKYHDASYFAAAHDFNSAQPDSDHIHEGLGFVPQHIKLTNMFEESVQSVDPSFALPYWDFTIDVSQNSTIYDSYMFTEDTFGTLTKPTNAFWGFTWSDDSLKSASIQDGRWKKLKVEKNTRYPDLGNAFGYMRGPWNMNPSPYLTRFSAYTPSLPSCFEYYGGLGMKDFMESLANAKNGPHASTHGVIGSVYGCDKMDYLREDEGLIKDEDSQLSMCKKWGFYLKELYRAGYISSGSDCTAESSLEEDDIDCSFTCNAEKYDSLLTEIKFLVSASYLNSGMKTSDWEKIRDFLCEGDGYKIFVGDHLESASAFDPSFWSIHPTQERLLQLKYMVGISFGEKDWPTDFENQYVCDKPSCYEGDSKDYYSKCCYGHFAYDQMLDFTTGNASQGFGPTNFRTLRDTDPTSDNYAMTYIYDDFDWDHCDEDFNGLIVNLFKQQASTDSPSAESTSKPTHKPTQAPTEEGETLKPTHKPTHAPTDSSDFMTSKPSHNPDTTHEPTGVEETNAPSHKPTHAPTKAPADASDTTDTSSTDSPVATELTDKPTHYPTKYPSLYPTETPTEAAPSTNSPSHYPTRGPTE